MNPDETNRVLDILIKFSMVAKFKGEFLISKRDNTLTGINVRFDPPLDLDNFPSIKQCMEILGK